MEETAPLSPNGTAPRSATKTPWMTPLLPLDWTHWLINQWAEQEGKPTIEWLDTDKH